MKGMSKLNSRGMKIKRQKIHNKIKGTIFTDPSVCEPKNGKKTSLLFHIYRYPCLN